MEKLRQSYYSRVDLKSIRFWTDELIAKLLGSPDETGKTFNRRSHRDLMLYLKERVYAAEARLLFIEHLECLQKKRDDAYFRQRVEEKMIDASVDSMSVDVEIIPVSDLELRLQKSWLVHYRNEEKPEEEALAELMENPDIYEAEMLSLVKFNLVKLPQIPKSVIPYREKYHAAVRLRDARTYEAIGAAYPSLAKVCERVMKYRGLKCSG